MIFASFIGIFVIPPLYVSFQFIREKLRPSTRPREERATASEAAATREHGELPATKALPPAE